MTRKLESNVNILDILGKNTAQLLTLQELQLLKQMEETSKLITIKIMRLFVLQMFY
ncbi:hypothetical protein D3C86_1955200 [compost metagenome]